MQSLSWRYNRVGLYLEIGPVSGRKNAVSAKHSSIFVVLKTAWLVEPKRAVVKKLWFSGVCGVLIVYIPLCFKGLQIALIFIIFIILKFHQVSSLQYHKMSHVSLSLSMGTQNSLLSERLIGSYVNDIVIKLSKKHLTLREIPLDYRNIVCIEMHC